jgi:hypothetical protein
MASAERSGEPPERLPGLTLRSVAAALLVILISGIIAQLAGVFDNANTLIGIEALPVPAMLALSPFAAALAGVFGLARAKILSRAELVCVLFAVLIATPIMGVGFWRYQLGTLSTIVRHSDWTKFEALPEGLWPHGPNLWNGGLETPGVVSRKGGEGGVVELQEGVARLKNTQASATSSIRVRVMLGEETSPLAANRHAVAVPGRPYLVTALVRARGLSPEANYFVRVSMDEETAFAAQPILARAEARATPLFPDGFTRVGYYPLELPNAKRSLAFDFGLHGMGTVEWRDLRLYDVRAIESAYKGFKRVPRNEYVKLALADRQNVIVVPDSLLSAAGVRYLLGLDYPVRDWLSPTLHLGAFMLLVFGATFGLALLYRKQWLEHERYPLPMARPLLILLGADESQGGLGQRFFRNFWLWLGFGVALLWCSLRVLHGYFPGLPDVGISVGVKSYLSDASWGHTWDGVEFQVLALFLGLGLMMELNVLLSLVVGYLLFRMQYWYGHAQGLTADHNFPYFPQQMLGAYVVYATLLIVFTRKYVIQAFRSALLGSPSDAEVRIQRGGILLFSGCLLGFMLWASWTSVPLFAAAVLALHVVLLGFIAAKFMAECGLPAAGFNHPLGQLGNYNVALEPLLLVPLLGGMSVFGGSGIITITLITSALLPFGFFLVPGLQVEALEVGRRFGVRSLHLALVALLSVVAAFVIGGFIYLTSAYGFGAAKFPDAQQFGERLGAFRAFNAELSQAQAALDGSTGAAAAEAGSATRDRLAALAFGGASAGAITVLRAFFPGFWFHPVGLLVGPSEMMRTLWGSLLVAYLIRLLVLRLGGSATVREKLIPAAVGIFVAAIVGHALYIAGNAYYFFFNKGTVKFMGLL